MWSLLGRFILSSAACSFNVNDLPFIPLTELRQLPNVELTVGALIEILVGNTVKYLFSIVLYGWGIGDRGVFSACALCLCI